MCGVSGILDFGGGRVRNEELARMNGSMVHRGPDDSGSWISPGGNLGLAHRRLSIIDLSSDAAQPMSNEDGTIWVSYNGEIYNHLDLRQELVAQGHRFRTDHSDTEVLVHGYEAWGVDGLVDRLEGMFAFALWDENLQKLFLVRDRVGVKPIYFTKQNRRLLFASEIKGILADPAIHRRADPLALYHYLTYLTAPAPLTLFDGIFKLPAAHIVEVSRDGGLAARRYWRAEPGRSGLGNMLISGDGEQRAEDLAREVFRRLEAAVEKRMMSDVGYGAFLSGGIDSSANVALMDRFTDKPVNTFTVGFRDHRHLNELDYADLVARTFRTSHHEILVDEQDMVAYIDELVHTQDEPLADWVCIPLHFVSVLARESGVKVIQVGEGSDEQFCGYNSYMKYLELDRRYFRPFQRYFPRFLQSALAGGALSLAKWFPGFEIYADAIDRARRGGEPFWSGAIAYWESQKNGLLNTGALHPPSGAEELMTAGLLPERFLTPDSAAVAETYLDAFDRLHSGADQLTRMISNEFSLRLPELLLMRVDKVTMEQSLEARVPFLDHALVELTMDIPAADKIAGGVQKQLLKQAVTGLIPDRIIHRPKMGFSAPMAQWLRGEFARRAEGEILASPLLDEVGLDRDGIRGLFRDHRSGRRDAALLIWVVYNLTTWHAHWIEGRA